VRPDREVPRVQRPLRARFAPSPSGDLHLGGAYTALANYVASDEMLIRVDDLDSPRVVPGATERILSDLAWLGLVGDSTLADGAPAVVFQSTRLAQYANGVARLDAAGLVYACDCSRNEIAALASAPHAGEELVYPGTCRSLPSQRTHRRASAQRIKVSAEELAFDDFCHAHVFSQAIATTAGDFVLRRADGIFAYHLASAFDDAELGIDLVLRGRDLLSSTPRQLWLQRLLNVGASPRYGHLGLVLDAAGTRLQKRLRPISIAQLRESGISAEQVVGQLAYALGVAATSMPTTAQTLRAALKHASDPIRWRTMDIAIAMSQLSN
jgi:glutamyl-tRNA synthetase